MKKSQLLALGLFCFLMLWMFSGHQSQRLVEPMTNTPIKSERIHVEITNSVAHNVMKQITVQGEIEPNRVLALKTEIDGKVMALPVKIGSRIAQGEALLTLEPQTRLAERQQAITSVNYQQQQLFATEKLFAKQLASNSDLSRDQAHLAAAKSALAKINYAIASTTIHAPFSGVYEHSFVELGDYVKRGDPVALLVDDLQLKITAMVPQKQVPFLTLGSIVTAQVITQQQFSGPVTFISAISDPKTRSFRIEVQIDNPNHARLAGMAATLTIAIEQVRAHLVNSSVISLDSQGRLQVKAVDSDNTVMSYVVEIVKADADKIWLSGLPNNVNLITLGQDFVVSGQLVTATTKEVVPQ